jgi:hypothetical protein
MSAEKKTPLDQSIVVSTCGTVDIRIMQIAAGRWKVYASGIEVDEAFDLGDAISTAERLYGAPVENWKRAAAI